MCALKRLPADTWQAIGLVEDFHVPIDGQRKGWLAIHNGMFTAEYYLPWGTGYLLH